MLFKTATMVPRAVRAPLLARTFATSSVRLGVVEDLYLSQLRSYTPPEKKDSLEDVRQFSLPKAPTAPESPTGDLDSALSHYKSAIPIPDVAAGETAPKGDEAGELLELLKSDPLGEKALEH